MSDDEEIEAGKIGGAAPGGRVAVLVGYGPRTTEAKRRPRKSGGASGSAEAHVVQARVPETVVPETVVPEPVVPEPVVAQPVSVPGAGSRKTLAKPPVRKLAKDLGVDLSSVPATGPEPSPVSRRAATVYLTLFVGLLVGLPLLVAIGGQPVALFDAFYRSGALVFGGGHVVLPLLHTSVVDPGWVSNDAFVAGYGAAQAVPGPLFTFAAYLGAVSNVPPNGWAGATIALVAIFLPSFLLVFGALPFWDRLRGSTGFRRALTGTNAAVVGILAAALYTPVWTSAIRAPIDVGIAALALGLLLTGRVAPLAVVALCAVAGQVIGA